MKFSALFISKSSKGVILSRIRYSKDVTWHCWLTGLCTEKLCTLMNATCVYHSAGEHTCFFTIHIYNSDITRFYLPFSPITSPLFNQRNSFWKVSTSSIKQRQTVQKCLTNVAANCDSMNFERIVCDRWLSKSTFCFKFMPEPMFPLKKLVKNIFQINQHTSLNKNFVKTKKKCKLIVKLFTWKYF